MNVNAAITKELTFLQVKDMGLGIKAKELYLYARYYHIVV